MLIYGIRCDKKILTALPHDTVADYYMNYGMLVFPSYTRPTVLDAKGRVTASFWETTRLIIQNPTQVYAMDLEQPFITDAEAAVVKIIQASESTSVQPDWYHVPFIVTPDTAPQLEVVA